MEKIIINNYIKWEPLTEENVDGVLDLVNEFRLSMPQKSIWLYTGYEFNEIFGVNQFEDLGNGYCKWTKRADIVSRCNILVDGNYIDSQRNPSLPYRDSKNQRLIDVQQSLQKGEVVLWQT